MQRLLLVVSLLGCTILTAQDFTQTLRGQIREAITGRPLVGATVVLTEQNLGATTDEQGRYRIENLTPGRYRLQVSYLGYEDVIVPEVLIVSGKETVLDFALQEATARLAPVTVRAPRSYQLSASPTLRTLSLEETLRFPATFYDPARLTASLPGVVATNDQSNHISVRGHSPNGLNWLLEGMEIVNPNHTPNAGTFSDRTTLNGGGVNALSAQLLDNSQFFSGAFPAGYGNALGGVLDMRLRPGNNEQREYTLQAGLIGIDVAAEGPLRKQQSSSFLVNYRYSFTGLLSDLGLQLGDEDIRFQDLSFHLVFPNQRGGRWTVFGMGGQSSNRFTGPEETEERETEKDVFRSIDFDSRVGIVGFSGTEPLGKKGQLRISSAWSILEADREGILTDTMGTLLQEESSARQQKRVWQASYRYKLGSLTALEAGVQGTQHQAATEVIPWQTTATTQDAYYRGWLWQPYLRWQQQWRSWSLQAGLHLSAYDEAFGGESAQYLEPRVSLEWRNPTLGSWSFSYGQHSQLQTPLVYDRPEGETILPTRAHHYVLGWKQMLRPTIEMQVQAYWQSLFDIPVSAEIGAFAATNILEEVSLGRLVNDGLGRNRGIEVSVQRFTGEGWSYLFSGTWFDAQYQGSDGIWRDSRFNGKYATSLTLGKEWAGTDQKEQPRRLGANMALRFSGGLRTAPIDVAASRAAGQTRFDLSNGFSEQLDDYFRVDLRIYYQRNRPQWSSTLSLDIQNASNQQNVAYQYFDTFLDEVVTRYQLELIPILSYRVQF